MPRSSHLLPATWNFPKRESSKKSKPVQEAIGFASYYQPPEYIHIDEADCEWVKADKLNRQQGQALRRAMGTARDWMSKQHWSIKDQVLGEYDFNWTAFEAIAKNGW